MFNSAGMNQWNQYTLLRLLMGYAIGVLLYSNRVFEGAIPLLLFVILFLLLVFVRYTVGRFTLYNLRFIAGIILWLMMIAFGYDWSRNHDLKNNASFAAKYYSGSEPVIVQVARPIEIKANSFKTVANIIAIETNNSWTTATGKVMLYFLKDSLAAKIQYGDRLIIYSTLASPLLPANPGEFDYSKYLARKNIHFQSFVRSDGWTKIGSGYGSALVEYSIRIRNHFLEIFERNNITGREFAVVNALVLGMDDYLDIETRKDFSASGAMHILCVSGLHVGIIYLVLNWLLSFLKRNKFSRLLKALLLLSGIWGYALLTGLSPSVLRASAMFSFVIVGSLLNRSGQIYNSLSASAFLLLLINPFLLHDVGFQLSYAAVLAIVSIQPLLYNLWRPDNYLLSKAWGLVTVSVAAQVGTFPLGLYYFHQFPNYFILTNLIVVPLATLILYSGFIVVLTSFFPLVSFWISQVLIILLKTLNSSVSFIEQLPYSTTSSIYVSTIVVLLLYWLIFNLFKTWTTKNIVFLKLALVVGILLASELVVREYFRQKQQKIIVYSVKNDAAIDLIQGRENAFISAAFTGLNPTRFEYQISGSRLQAGIRKTSFLCFDSLGQNPENQYLIKPFKAQDPFLAFRKATLLIIKNDFPYAYLADTLHVDLALVYDDRRIVPEDFFRKIKPGYIVVSNKVPYRSIEAWRKVLRNSGTPFHIIHEKGAFVMPVAD